MDTEKHKFPIDKLASTIVAWISETVSAAGAKGVVLGMSGGVDSSVVAVLCHRAFPDTTLGVVMPCYSNPADRNHAELVASKFHVPVVVVPLDGAFDALLKVLPDKGAGEGAKRMAESNLKPRLRMLTLYYLANSHNYLVAGSSNRCELTVGYYTKYGDSGVDLLPLGGLVKGQVRELAEYLEIPREIIDKPPSAGLWEGQTDEGEMGLTYDALDRYLLTGKASESIKRKIDSMASKAIHKRHLPPVCPY